MPSVRYHALDNISTTSSDDALLDPTDQDTIPFLGSRERNQLTFHNNANASDTQSPALETGRANGHANGQAYRKYMLDRISHNLFFVNLITLTQLAILILALYDINNFYDKDGDDKSGSRATASVYNLNMDYFYWYAWTLIILNIIFSSIPILIFLGIMCNLISYDKSFVLIHMNIVIFAFGFLPRYILATFIVSNIIGNHPLMLVSNTTIQHNITPAEQYEVFIPNYLLFIFLDWIIYASVFVYCGYINGVLSVINY
jgi:hypothetical protein